MKKLWLIPFFLIIISLFVILYLKNTLDVQDANWETGLIPAELIPELDKLEAESLGAEGLMRLDMPLGVDENYLYALTRDNYIVKYDKHNGFKKVMSKSAGTSRHIRDFAVDNNFLYTISWDGNIRIYNKTDLNEHITIQGHSSAVTAIYLTDDFIYTGSWDCYLKVWDKTDFLLVNAFFAYGDHGSQNLNECCKINSIAVDDNKVYIACENNQYSLIIDQNKKESYMLKVAEGIFSEDGAPLFVESVDFDEKYLYFAYDKFLKIFDKKNLQLIKRFTLPNSLRIIKSGEGMVNVGGEEVFYFFDKSNSMFTKPIFPQNHIYVHNLALDEKNVYIGSLYNQIFVIDKDDKQVKTFFEIN